MTDSDNPKSWSESIKAYDSSKKSVAWKPEDINPVVRLDPFQRRTLEREVDPILMQYRDPAKEEVFTETLRSKLANKKPRAQAGQKFNIINHQGPRPKPIDTGNQNHGRREWNILSHFPSKLHTKAPLEFNQDFQIECTKRKTLTDGIIHHRGREYSILSNKFNENDTSRRIEEHLKVQAHLRKEYERTRIYDPVKVQSYNEEQEALYKTQVQEKILESRNRQEDFIPKSTKFAEGNTYNILTTEITNADRLLQKPDRALNRFKGTAEKIEAAKSAGDQRATIEDARRLNRISYDRWDKSIDRGFDFVFGGPVELVPLPKPRPSIWSRLHSDVPPPQLPKTATATSFRTKDLSNLQPSQEDLHSPYKQHFKSSEDLAPRLSTSPIHSSSSSLLDNSTSKSSQAFLSQRADTSSSRRPIPPLNLNACPPSPVSYKVPRNGLPGEQIAMVRTGGLSAFE